MAVVEVGSVRSLHLQSPKSCRKSTLILLRALETFPSRKCASALGSFIIFERYKYIISMYIYVYVYAYVVCIWLVEFRFRSCLDSRRLIFRCWSRWHCTLEKSARRLGTRYTYKLSYIRKGGGYASRLSTTLLETSTQNQEHSLVQRHAYSLNVSYRGTQKKPRCKKFQYGVQLFESILAELTIRTKDGKIT